LGDFFTKALPWRQFQEHRGALMTALPR
jgi:hypothetical protein